ncbi:MAG: hypothetical protein ACD_75C02342G0003 [uncultured bacterium]|nr:MAG: hypothetical protein ACD_75C02342G0003 [uncultured bacterium]
MAKPGTLVDVIRPDRRPHELLHQIILFICAAGGGETGNGVRPVRGFYGAELFRDEVKRLIPCGLMELPVFLDKRFCEALFAIDKFVPETSLHAKTTPIRSLALLGGYANNPFIEDIEFQLAATAAVSAGGFNLFRHPGSPLDSAEVFRQGPGGAKPQAFAAGFTFVNVHRGNL